MKSAHRVIISTLLPPGQINGYWPNPYNLVLEDLTMNSVTRSYLNTITVRDVNIVTDPIHSQTPDLGQVSIQDLEKHTLTQA